MQNPFGESPFPQPSDHPPQEGLRSRGYLRAAAAFAATVLALTGCSKPPVGAEQLPSPTPSITAVETPGATPTPENTPTPISYLEKIPEEVRAKFKSAESADITNVKITAEDMAREYVEMFQADIAGMTNEEIIDSSGALITRLEESRTKLNRPKLPANYQELKAAAENKTIPFSEYQKAAKWFFESNATSATEKPKVYFDGWDSPDLSQEFVSVFNGIASPANPDNPKTKSRYADPDKNPRIILLGYLDAFSRMDKSVLDGMDAIVLGDITPSDPSGMTHGMTFSRSVKGSTKPETVVFFDIAHQPASVYSVVAHESYHSFVLQKLGAQMIDQQGTYLGDPGLEALNPKGFKYAANGDSTYVDQIKAYGSTTDGHFTSLDAPYANGTAVTMGIEGFQERNDDGSTLYASLPTGTAAELLTDSEGVDKKFVQAKAAFMMARIRQIDPDTAALLLSKFQVSKRLQQVNQRLAETDDAGLGEVQERLYAAQIK